MDNHGPCALCDQNLECIDHLLLCCAFSREVWFLILQHFGWQMLAPMQDEGMVKWWLRMRRRLPK
jgi:hypothetical protein